MTYWINDEGILNTLFLEKSGHIQVVVLLYIYIYIYDFCAKYYGETNVYDIITF